MAEEHQHVEVTGADKVDFQERGLFDFGKKEEKKDEEQVLVSEMEKVHLEDESKKSEEHEKPGLLEKLHRSHSTSSSSSSDEEEVDENGEKKKKKKGLKEKIKEKMTGEKKEGEETVVTGDHDSAIKVEKVEDASLKKEEEVPAPEEKKGFLEKIKEKLPMQSKKPAEEVVVSAPVETKEQQHDEEGQANKEKKGFLEKIKEKLPGYHKNGGDETTTGTTAATTTTNSGGAH
ncbi:hypothetical protein J5N97_022670 [Dioscorea zingiberensis]|uniref:Dehydrin n=1 Tax=Dioscorea zingiberensis TaxID=325984 RepID=A0A9D5CAU2_9LILI|nr:hypothetical protein J5N97_022670 [Dioscorea zingiberensis]